MGIFNNLFDIDSRDSYAVTGLNKELNSLYIYNYLFYNLTTSIKFSYFFYIFMFNNIHMSFNYFIFII